MTCGNKEYRDMSVDELQAHHEFHHRQSDVAFNAGDSYGWRVESRRASIMFFRWAEALSKQNNEPLFWVGPGRRNYDLGIFIAGLEAELTMLEAFGGIK